MTALITGASSGIGLELAKIFAANKHDLVLVARSEAKIQALANELSTQHGIKTYVCAKDLSRTEDVEGVIQFTNNNQLQIDFLINNAGFGDFGFFHESNWNKLQEMIRLNMESLTRLCWHYVKPMIQKKQGKILNVASTAAFQPGPTMAVYYATKAYVLHFSEAISNELEHTGVTVTALCPGATESGFQQLAAMEESKLVKGKKLPSSKEVAEYGYKSMMRGKKVAIHGTLNYIMANSIRFTPRVLVLKVVRWMQDKS